MVGGLEKIFDGGGLKGAKQKIVGVENSKNANVWSDSDDSIPFTAAVIFFFKYFDYSTVFLLFLLFKIITLFQFCIFIYI